MDVNVVDLLWGDSGKGLATSFLCNQLGKNTLVTRYNGGQQAGHTVNYNGINHIFSQMGSGTLQGHNSYFHKTCTFYPLSFMKEYYVLTKNFTPKNKLLIHKNTMLTTIYDVEANRVNSIYKDNGTCGMGFGTTIQRNLDGCVVTVGDMLYPSVFKNKLKTILKYYNTKYKFIKHELNDLLPLYNDYLDCLDYIEIVDEAPYDNYDNVIFEGAQGMMLDERWGNYPHTTWSKVNKKCDNVLYVIRSYMTRHGNDEYFENDSFLHYKDTTNVHNIYQGNMLFSRLNTDYINYTLSKDYKRKNRSLLITHMDQNEINVTNFLKKINVYFDKVYVSYGPNILDIKRIR